MKFPGEEPNAEVRMLASTMRQMHVAFTQVGFTEKQSLMMLTEVIKASISAINLQKDE